MKEKQGDRGSNSNHNSSSRLITHESDSALPIPKLSNQVGLVIVTIAAIICFGNSLDGHFVFDDAEAIINNDDLKPETPVWNLLQNDFWGTRLSHNRSHRSYRPITILSFRLNYWLAGGLNPHGFHLTNILLHSITCALSLPVLNLLYGKGKNQLSILTALLFAVHPIHTEAVAGVVGRADLLSTFFSFLAFLSYAYSADDTIWIQHTQWRMAILASRAVLLLLSMILVALALFSKEQGITIIGICSAYDILIICRLTPFKLISSVGNKGRFEKGVIRWLAFRHFFLITAASALLVARWRVMGGRTPSFQQVDNPASFERHFWSRVLSYHYIYALNLWLLLCPEWLCFDWSMGCVPLLRLPDFRVIFVVIFWLGLILLGGSCFSKSESFSRRSVNIALAVLILPFSPASNILFRVGFVLAERILYLPSLGYCMLVLLGMRQLALACPRTKWLIVVGFSGLLLVFSMRSIQRSAEWRDEETLFRSGLRVCPQNAKVHYNVAKNAGDMGDRKIAVDEYRIALKLYPDYEQAMNNLANILKDQGQLEEAERLLRRAVELRADFAAAWMNLGVVLSALQRHAEAEQSYLTAVRHRSHFPDCFYNLGNLYLDQKRYDEALTAWRNATRQRPTHAIAWNNMIVMLDNIGDLARAEAVAREAINLVPRDPSLQFNLANTLGKRGRFAEAERHFMVAVDLDPLNAVYHSNMGVLYHRWKKYESAERSYLTALGLNPQLKSAQDNLAMLHRNMAKMGLKP